MSKPGGKPIVKKRPFFEDENMAISTQYENSRMVGYEFTNKISQETKIFKVDNKYQMIKAWQEMEKYADPIAYELLKQKGKINRSRLKK